MKTVSQLLAAASFTGMLVAGVPASAAPTVFTDQAAFERVVGKAPAFDFSTLAPGTYQGGVRVASVSFHSNATVDVGAGNNGRGAGVGYSADPLAGPAFDVDTANGYLGLFIQTFSKAQNLNFYVNGERRSLALTNSSSQLFLGVVANEPIRLDFSLDRGDSISISRFETGTAVVAPAPEPGTWAIMIVGFGMVGALMRRRRDQVATRVRFA